MTDSGTWLNKIEPAILDSLEEANGAYIPPHFPFAELAKKIAQTFHMEHLEFALGLSEVKSQDSLFSGLGKNPISLPLELTPLKGSFFWIMASEDVKKLLSWMKFSPSPTPLVLSHHELLKGIYRYVVLEVIDMIAHLKTYQALSPKLIDKQSFDETMYAIDLSIKHHDQVVWGRLALSPAFKHAFADHYALKRITLKDLKGSFDTLSIPLSLNIGSVELTPKELKKIRVGDFLIPDALHYNPESEKGNIRIMMGDKPILIAKPKEDHVKLIDFIYAYEEGLHG